MKINKFKETIVEKDLLVDKLNVELDNLRRENDDQKRVIQKKDKEYKSLNDRIEKMMIEHKNLKNDCEQLKKDTESNSKVMKENIEDSDNKAANTCKSCEFEAKSSRGLQIHIKSKHKITCEKCNVDTESHDLYHEHMRNVHEMWKVTQQLCDFYCNGEHGMHMCFSNESFNRWKGFEQKNIEQNIRNCEPIYKCLDCETREENELLLRKHITEVHVNASSKCGLCDFRFHTWIEMTNHYEANHMTQDEY